MLRFRMASRLIAASAPGKCNKEQHLVSNIAAVCTQHTQQHQFCSRPLSPQLHSLHRSSSSSAATAPIVEPTAAASADAQPEKATSPAAYLLTNPNFVLSREWAERFKQLDKQKLGYDPYEWISLVQKKYSGGGKASAVDLDIACALAQHPDQMRELLDLCYKLRHTDNAADMFPSTEYAMFRLFLDQNDLGNCLRMLNDPLNFGLFPNEHCCCLMLDRFLSSGDFQVVARLAAYAMQQEFFDWPVLNYLSVRALLQFVESTPLEQEGQKQPPCLPEFEERVLPRRAPTLEEEMNFNEENVKMFRFPWLKVPFWDGHFDLDRADQLVGKALEWFSWHLKLAEQNEAQKKTNSTLVAAIHFLGLSLQSKWAQAEEALAKARSEGVSPILLVSLQLARPNLEKPQADGEKAEKAANEEKKKLLTLIDTAIGECQNAMPDGNQPLPKLWRTLAEAFRPIQAVEEQKLMEHQKREFIEWSRKRMEFIESQTQRLELSLRLDELRERRKSLVEERELLFFFESRHFWEDRALQRHQLEEHLGMLKKRGHLTEEEYGKTLFGLGQLLKEGKTAIQALQELQPGTGPTTGVALTSAKPKKK